MKTITFTIHGNQENPHGNPMPYYRITSQSRFSDGAKRYHAWANFVRAQYLDIVMPRGKKFKTEDYGEIHDFIEKRPIPASKEKQWMGLKIYWADKKHGDCDNIYKGIADALFMNDKYLACTGIDYEYALDKKGKVEITLTI